MKNFKTYSYLLLLILFLSSCISEFNAKLPSGDEEILIVDGNIIANKDVVFHLSKSFPLETPGIPQVSTDVVATVVLVGSDGFISSPATSLGKGSYRISIGDLKDDVSYGIQVSYANNTYTSELMKPMSTPPIDSISWIQPDNDGDVFFSISTHGSGKDTKYYTWNYIEDWETKAYYYTIFFYDPVKKSYYTDYSPTRYYCWKNNNQNKILIGTTESLIENRIINKQFLQESGLSDRFSVLYSINVVQRALSKGAYEYYQNQLKLNEDMGGLFTPQPSEIEGNIICKTDPSKKVIGFVEVLKNVAEKRIFINSNQIVRRVFPNCQMIPPDSLDSFMFKNNMLSLTDLYRAGYRPVAGSYTRDEEYDGWTFDVCTDCVIAGGSKNKPDFWPNDHK